MSNFEQLRVSSDLIMKSVVIGNDLAFVAKANATLQRVGCHPDVSARWTVKSWLVNAVTQATMAEETLVAAADANLIVIPTRYAHAPPFWLRKWLERWTALRQIEDAALAVIDDCVDADFTGIMSPELALFARKHGLNLITDEGTVAKDETKVFVRFASERELPLPIAGSRFAYAAACDPFRGFGINE
jgi:hypothetical protein